MGDGRNWLSIVSSGELSSLVAYILQVISPDSQAVWIDCNKIYISNKQLLRIGNGN
jgi:hypothetical protein